MKTNQNQLTQRQIELHSELMDLIYHYSSVNRLKANQIAYCLVDGRPLNEESLKTLIEAMTS